MFESDFLLKTPTARMLYHEAAEHAPIYDYHCHLNPQEIFEDQVFESITAMWLGFDHYKWRAMRFAGVPEKYITGDGTDLEKFKAFAKTLERLVGSPLYHWTHLELAQFFGIREYLTSKNAEEIYTAINAKIQTDALSPVKLIEASEVKLICTTDDPADDLSYHAKIREKNHSFQVLPTFRPDKVLKIEAPDFLRQLENLSNTMGKPLTTLGDLKVALASRIAYFAAQGAVLSDHSLEALTPDLGSEAFAEELFLRALQRDPISVQEAAVFRNHMLIFLAGQYHKHGMAMQLHLGAMRNNNARYFEALGPDTGFDLMNDFPVAESLSLLLKAMDAQNGLPKTILYTLNAKDNAVLSTLPHCYPEDGVPGKVQFGPAWWFFDHKSGMETHLTDLGNQGMLADFIGMLTDSRSFLSYARHDYFRRILCNYLGNLVENQEFNDDPEILLGIVRGITHENIKKYLGVD